MGKNLIDLAIQSRVSSAAIFYALLVTGFFLPETSPFLNQTGGNQLGISVLEAVDAGARNLSFYRFIGIFIVSLGVLHLVFTRGILKIPPSIRQFSESVAKVGIMLILSSWLAPDMRFYSFFPAAIHVGFFLCKPFHPDVSEQHARTALFYAILVWMLIQWLLPPELDIIYQAVQIFILFSVFSFLSSSKTMLLEKPNKAILATLSWLVFFIPEIQYFLFYNSRVFASPYFLWCLFFVAIFGSSFFFRYKDKAKAEKTSWLFLSIGLGLLAFFKPKASAPEELFELANRALPLMELHYFQTIPLLEKASSHFVSDYGFGLIYQLIHGYQGLDFLIYDIFDHLIWIISGFLLISVFFKDHLLAFFFTALFPFADASFPPYYAIAVLLPLLLPPFVSWNAQKSAIGFGLCFAILLPWRADLSFACLISLMVVLGLMLYKKVINLRFLFPSIIFTAALSIVLALVASKNKINWMESLELSLQYLNSNDSYALPDLGKSSQSLFVLAHLILPLAIIYITFKTIIQLREEKIRHELYLILFMSVFYLVNLPRGIVRHGYAEGFDNFLLSFAPLIISLFLGFQVFSRKRSRTVFIFASLCLFNLFLRYPAREPEKTSFYSASAAPLKADFFADQPDKIRLNYNSEKINDEIIPLANYLRNNLAEDETFLDMGNMPMIYFYAEKPVPSFFYQSPQNVHSIEMQKAWIRTFKEQKIPLVLMRHVPESWWDRTDGVPNEVRHYPVFEYLYQHYCFKEIVSGYEIWSECKTPLSSDSAFEMRQLYRFIDLKRLPAILNLPSIKFIEADTLQSKQIYSVPDTKPEWIQIKIEKINEPEQAQIVFMKNGIAYGGFEFVLDAKLSKEYCIRPGMLYSWWRMQPDSIGIKVPDHVKIKSVKFAKELTYL